MIRSSSVYALGSVVKLVAALVRGKTVAVLGGPLAVGQYGLLLPLLNSAVTLANLGVPFAGVREVAAAAGNEDGGASVARTCTVVRRVTLAGSTVVSAAVVLASGWISRVIFDDGVPAWAVAVVGVGIVLESINNSRTSILNGMRKPGLMLALSLIRNGLGAIVVALAVAIDGVRGLAWGILGMTVCGAVGGLLLERRAAPRSVTMAVSEIVASSRGLFGLGLTVCLSSSLTMVGALVLRSLIAGDIGVDRLALYLAAASLSSLAFDFLFGVVAKDFLPRVSAAAGDPSAVQAVVDRFMLFLVWLTVPIVVLGVCFSELLLQLAYSHEFVPAAGILVGCVAGNVFKVPALLLTSVLIAEGQTRRYAVLQAVGVVARVVVVYGVVRGFGLAYAGAAELALNAALLLGTAAVSFGAIPVRLSQSVVLAGGILLAAAAASVSVFMASDPLTWPRWLAVPVALACGGKLLVEFRRETPDGSA